MKNTQECPQAPSGHEVCPCTHAPCEPPQAQQGINKETYPPPNKQPPRAPRRRPNANKKSKTTRQHRVDATRTCRPPKQVCYTIRHAASRRKGAVVRTARGKGHNGRATSNKRACPLSSPARIGRGRHETSKVPESIKTPQNIKRHTEKQRKAHHTKKHTQQCPRALSGHEVCPCTHAPCEPPQAKQGINKETYPPPNKQPPRAPRRRPTIHVCFLCFLYSRPPARKEAWYEGHPQVTERREPHATGERTTATKHTYHKPKGTRGARGMPAHARVRQTS